MEELGILDKVAGFINEWWPVLTSVVGTFAVVATITPNKADNRIAQVLLDIVNFLGANLGKSKNDPAVN